MRIKSRVFTVTIIVFFTIFATISSLLYTGKIWLVYPDRNEFPIRGIDVSHHQGEINWQKVANGDVAFAYIKATEANDLKDRLFTHNWHEAQKAGILVGAYHFYSLAYPGKIQSQNFIGVVPTSTSQLRPVIDLEYVGNSKTRPSKIEFQKELGEYISIVTNHYNTKPIFYTTYDFYEEYLTPEFTEYDIWIRDIYSKPNQEVEGWLIWQYSPRGRVEGIEGYVDLNVLNGNILNKLRIEHSEAE